jgi:hypothetical protein
MDGRPYLDVEGSILKLHSRTYVAKNMTQHVVLIQTIISLRTGLWQALTGEAIELPAFGNELGSAVWVSVGSTLRDTIHFIPMTFTYLGRIRSAETTHDAVESLGYYDGSNSYPTTRKRTDRIFDLFISSWLDKHSNPHCGSYPPQVRECPG